MTARVGGAGEGGGGGGGGAVDIPACFAATAAPADRRRRRCGSIAPQDKVFYNTYGLDNDDEGRTKALGADFKDMFFGGVGPRSQCE